jgi:hypothetical protein
MRVRLRIGPNAFGNVLSGISDAMEDPALATKLRNLDDPYDTAEGRALMARDRSGKALPDIMSLEEFDFAPIRIDHGALMAAPGTRGPAPLEVITSKRIPTLSQAYRAMYGKDGSPDDLIRFAKHNMLSNPNDVSLDRLLVGPSNREDLNAMYSVASSERKAYAAEAKYEQARRAASAPVSVFDPNDPLCNVVRQAPMTQEETIAYIRANPVNTFGRDTTSYAVSLEPGIRGKILDSMRYAAGKNDALQVGIGFVKSWLYFSENTYKGVTALPGAAEGVYDSLANRGFLETYGSGVDMMRHGFHSTVYGSPETRGTFLFNLLTAPVQAELGGMVTRPIVGSAKLGWEASSGFRQSLATSMGVGLEAYLYKSGALMYAMPPASGGIRFASYSGNEFATNFVGPFRPAELANGFVGPQRYTGGGANSKLGSNSYSGVETAPGYIGPVYPSGTTAIELDLKGYESINIIGNKQAVYSEVGPDYSITLFRGVHGRHPEIDNARMGRTVPAGGHDNPEWHNGGSNGSNFTSWSQTQDGVLSYWKNNGYDSGVILQQQVPRQQLIWSPDQYREIEVLRHGDTYGAQVIPWSK